jgi:hypothetical protein
MESIVPVYNVGHGSNDNSMNPWAMMAAMNGGFGGGANFIWPLMLFWLFGMGGYGGFGGFGGFGGRGFGGFGGCGAGPAFADLAVTDATNIAELKAGANFTAQGVNGLREGLSNLNVNLCSQFANLNTAVTTAAYQNQLGQRDLQAQIADCCCRTQSGLAEINNTISHQLCQLNYNMAMQNCETKQAIAAEGAATRQLILDQQTEMLKAKLAEANQQLFVLKNFGQYASGNGCCNNGCGSC